MDGSRIPRTAALLAVAALVAGALLPALRLPVLAGLLAGLALTFVAHRPAFRLPFAATIPAAVLLALRAIPPPVPADLAWCTDPVAPVVLWRGLEAALTIGSVLALCGVLGVSLRSIGLVRPGRRELAASVAAAVVIAGGALAVGTTIAVPFFGEIGLSMGDPASLLPAVAGALANGALEETIYRGAMLAWLTPVTGLRAAIVLQALVFGAGHAGADFTGSPLPVMAAVAGAGVVAGILASVRRSLTAPIALHAGFDVPLFYVAACRIG